MSNTFARIATGTFTRRNALRFGAASVPVVAGLVYGTSNASAAAAAAAPSIEIIDAVSQTTQVTVRPAAGTPGTVRYEDLYRPGMTLQQVFTAAGNSVSTSKQIILTFPAGEFFFSDFTQNDMYGIRIPSNVGIAGSGRDGANATVFKMKVRSSTRAGQVPQPGSGQTNQFTYMGIQNAGAVQPPTGMVFKNFAIIGTDQGHLYNGFRLQNCVNPVLSNIYIEGMAGNQAAPPGETFGINLYKGSGAQLTNIEVDGRRTRQGGTESIASSPIGYNNHSDSTMTNCYFHHCQYGMPTFWQSNDCTTINCRSEYNKTGFNHERATRITHKNVTIKLGGERPHHFTMMNDQATGILTIHNPTWDLSSASPSGKLVIQMGARGTGVIDKQTTPPTVTGANGESIMTKVLVAGN